MPRCRTVRDGEHTHGEGVHNHDFIDGTYVKAVVVDGGTRAVRDGRGGRGMVWWRKTVQIDNTIVVDQ